MPWNNGKARAQRRRFERELEQQAHRRRTADSHDSAVDDRAEQLQEQYPDMSPSALRFLAHIDLDPAWRDILARLYNR